MNSDSKYYANGKLLLTAEYLVIHGAKAIALPLKVGQHLKVTNHNTGDSIIWNAYFQNKLWFGCEFSTNLELLKYSNLAQATTLISIFESIKKLDPGFKLNQGSLFETQIDSNPEWGFGSSSTLISLLSQYSGVDPFSLNDLTFNGSGFDIACATASGPFIYTRHNPIIPIKLDYPFSKYLYLVYSGQKLATKAAISTFLKSYLPDEKTIANVSDLTNEIADCSTFDGFNKLIALHENIIGSILNETPLKQKYFADFDGEIKSLGAWGGDFYLVSSKLPLHELLKYFELKGINCVLKFDEFVLRNKIENE